MPRMAMVLVVALTAHEAGAQVTAARAMRSPQNSAEGVPAQAVPTHGRMVRTHRALGTVALGAFSTALVIGAASGNLGKLTDASACCPDGGTRDATWRRVDRTLVTVGIVSYAGSAALAGIGFVRRRENPDRSRHRAHRWLALAHGAAFATSAVTGSMMRHSQSTDAARFARVARIHVAANVALVPLLTAAYSNIVFER